VYAYTFDNRTYCHTTDSPFLPKGRYSHRTYRFKCA